MVIFCHVAYAYGATYIFISILCHLLGTSDNVCINIGQGALRLIERSLYTVNLTKLSYWSLANQTLAFAKGSRKLKGYIISVTFCGYTVHFRYFFPYHEMLPPVFIIFLITGIWDKKD